MVPPNHNNDSQDHEPNLDHELRIAQLEWWRERTELWIMKYEGMLEGIHTELSTISRIFNQVKWLIIGSVLTIAAHSVGLLGLLEHFIKAIV